MHLCACNGQQLKKADSIAEWPVSTLALRKMYKILARASCQLHPSPSKTVESQWLPRSSLEQGTGRAGQRSVGSRGLKQVLPTSARGERGREPSP